MTMTDEELIAALRKGRLSYTLPSGSIYEGPTIIDRKAADRLEALTQPSGKVSDEQVTLADCPIGLFERGGELCLKTEYGNNEGRIDAYIVSSGEFFWGGASTPAEQRKVLVRPVSAQLPARPVVSENDPRWIMGGTLAPTDSEIRDAANKWCGDKERETFLSDVTYFRNNWRALNGLKAYVAREVSSRADLAEKRIAALSALEGEGHE